MPAASGGWASLPRLQTGARAAFREPGAGLAAGRGLPWGRGSGSPGKGPSPAVLMGRAVGEGMENFLVCPELIVQKRSRCSQAGFLSFFSVDRGVTRPSPRNWSSKVPLTKSTVG